MVGPRRGSTLRRLLADQDPRVRRAAASALGQTRAEASLTVPALVELLEAKDTKDRLVAIDTLESVGEWSQAVSLFAELLADKDPRVRLAVVAALGEIPLEPDAETRRFQNPQDSEDQHQFRLAEARRGIPALAKLLKDENAVMRRSAAHALTRLGPEAAEMAFSTMVEALAVNDAAVRRDAASALGRMANEDQAHNPGPRTTAQGQGPADPS